MIDTRQLWENFEDYFRESHIRMEQHVTMKLLDCLKRTVGISYAPHPYYVTVHRV